MSMNDDVTICEECEQEKPVATTGRFEGLCASCINEFQREDAAYTRDHLYVFGQD